MGARDHRWYRILLQAAQGNADPDDALIGRKACRARRWSASRRRSSWDLDWRSAWRTEASLQLGELGLELLDLLVALEVRAALVDDEPVDARPDLGDLRDDLGAIERS